MGEGGVMQKLLELPAVASLAERLHSWFGLTALEVENSAHDIAQAVGLKLADLFGTVLTRVPMLAMGLVVMIVSLFFFLVDGRRILRFIRDASVFTVEETEELIRSTGAMCRSVILATVFSGVGQALLFGVGSAICGVPNAPLIGLLTFLASFIPIIGAVPLTFGVAIYQGLDRGLGWGITLAVIAAATALVDNFIRPLVLKGGGNLHPLLAFVAAFGGLQVFGFVGVFLGPILAGMGVLALRHWLARRRLTLP
jgi:predicted PurR-regulated permease PerM